MRCYVNHMTNNRMHRTVHLPGCVNVYADPFDQNGKFIYQCMHQFNEGLRKGQRANFMIQCHGMPAELATSYETHKVYARTF